jgi:hypothetical protein
MELYLIYYVDRCAVLRFSCNSHVFTLVLFPAGFAVAGTTYAHIHLCFSLQYMSTSYAKHKVSLDKQ